MNQLINDLDALVRDCASPYREVKPGGEEPPCGTLLLRLMERQEQAQRRPDAG